MIFIGDIFIWVSLICFYYACLSVKFRVLVILLNLQFGHMQIYNSVN